MILALASPTSALVGVVAGAIIGVGGGLLQGRQARKAAAATMAATQAHEEAMYRRERRDRLLPAVHEYAACLRRVGRHELRLEPPLGDPWEGMEEWRRTLVPYEHDLPLPLLELMYHRDLASPDPTIHGVIVVRIADALDSYWWEQNGGSNPLRTPAPEQEAEAK